MDREEDLGTLATEARGLRYDSKEAIAILDQGDWSDWWPIVDNKGLLTGEITDCPMGGEPMANVNDMAMIPHSQLTTEQVRLSSGWDFIKSEGYARLEACSPQAP